MPNYAAERGHGNRIRGVKYDVAMRLLLVEDDPGVLRFVLKGLREQAYAVDTAMTGDDALYQAEINTYDLIILDVMIPGRDGFAVCKQIRAMGNRVPILMLTALDGVEDRIAGLDVGADDYLTKPFAVRELLARLRALLRRSGELRPADIIVADLVVETAGQTVTRGGRHIALTTKEYALVEFLARNAGRVVGRAAIAQHVWDETFDPFSNLIEVYVNRLRRKIDADSKVPLLHTRRGAGYLFGPAGENARVNDGVDRGEQRPSRKKLSPASKKNHV
jgi:two-component system, OmpR family, copper resistance phosphate regulon response regulator CusR